MSSNDQNLINPDAYAIRVTVLDAAAHGSVDTLVAFFAGATVDFGNIPAADWIARTDSANEGSSFKILRRGLYFVRFNLSLNTSANVGAAITYDAPAAVLNTSFNASSPSVRDFGRLVTATTVDLVQTAAMINVSQLEADTATLGIIRAQLIAGVGGPAVPAQLIVSDAQIQIVRANDCLGG